MDFSVLDALYIVDQEAKREFWNYVGVAVAALYAVLGFAYIVTRPAFLDALGRLKRICGFERVFLVALFLPVFIYGSTKKTAVVDFHADECPDSVTFTWNEETDGLVVQAVQIERRVKGATEGEAWERWGEPVPGGQKRVTIDGFTIDRDYEYRARYTYTEGN